MTRKSPPSPPSATTLCSLERKWRSSPENAALPRALRAVKSRGIAFIADVIGVTCLAVFTYGLLLAAWVMS